MSLIFLYQVYKIIILNKIKRGFMATINYLRGVRAGNTEIPSQEVQTQIAQVLDHTCESIVKEYEGFLKGSQDIKRCVNNLNREPRVTGPFDPNKVLFRNYSPFEQFHILDEALKVKEYRLKHTFRFAAGENDHILVQVNKLENKRAGLMHCVLGSGKNAPKYEQWAESDPNNSPGQKVFIAPLLQLENIRQRYFVASTTLKTALYDNSHIDSLARYGQDYACVELKKQHSPENASTKQQSAGKVFSYVVNEFVDFDAPGREEITINPDTEYENFFREGYDDDFNASVTPSDVMEGLLQHYEDNSDELLRKHLENLFISTMGPVHEPTLQDHLEKRLEANKKIET